MTIAYFVNMYPVKNQHVVEDEALMLLRRGHNAYIIPVWGRLAEMTKVPKDLRARVLSIPLPFSPGTIFRNILSGLSKPFTYLSFMNTARRKIGIAHTMSLIALAWQLQRSGVDRIHGHFASTGALHGLLAADWMNVPYSCTGHGTDVLIKRADFLPELIQRSNPFITISDYNRQCLISDLDGVSGAEIRVVHCGIKLDEYQPQPSTIQPIAVPTILSVTWLRDVKGVPFLIEACARIKQRGAAFRCVIVGGGDLYEETVRQIQDYKLEDHIQLTGALPHSEVMSWYQQAHLFVLPSLSEGISVALMEAMAMKLPVIATRITGIPELVTHEQDGLLVEPGNAEALAEAMETMLNAPERWQDLGQNGRQKVEQEYNIEKNMDRMIEIFSE